jgi:rhodanese-related sulfurtransferase
MTPVRGRIGPMFVPSVAVTEMPADAPLLDVRESDEWVAGHAPTAQHLPMSELTARLDELPDDEPLYVICRSGGRSARVVAYLAGQGYPAVNVDGGMQAWAAQGRAVVADAGTPQIV